MVVDKNVKENLLSPEDAKKAKGDAIVAKSDAKEAKGDYCTTVEREFEHVRFTVAYMTYQRMN